MGRWFGGSTGEAKTWGNPDAEGSGRLVAPAIGAVIGDAGALPVGDYCILLTGGVSDTIAVGKGIVFEHRNAGNTATLRQLGQIPPASSLQIVIFRKVIAANERIRAIAGSVAGAASSVYIAYIAVWKY